MKFPTRALWIFLIFCWLGWIIFNVGAALLWPLIVVALLLLLLGISFLIDRVLIGHIKFLWPVEIEAAITKSRSLWKTWRAEIDFRQVGCFVVIGGGAYVLGGFAAIFLICAVFMVAGLIFDEAMKELKAAVLKEIRSALRKDEP